LTNEVQSLRKTAFGPYSVDDKTGLDEFIKLLDQQAKSPNSAAPAPSRAPRPGPLRLQHSQSFTETRKPAPNRTQ
jgi:hypothetical protein